MNSKILMCLVTKHVWAYTHTRTHVHTHTHVRTHIHNTCTHTCTCTCTHTHTHTHTPTSRTKANSRNQAHAWFKNRRLGYETTCNSKYTAYHYLCIIFCLKFSSIKNRLCSIEHTLYSQRRHDSITWTKIFGVCVCKSMESLWKLLWHET